MDFVQSQSKRILIKVLKVHYYSIFSDLVLEMTDFYNIFRRKIHSFNSLMFKIADQIMILNRFLVSIITNSFRHYSVQHKNSFSKTYRC